MDDLDFDSFLSDLKGSLDKDSFDWDAPVSESAPEPRREEVVMRDEPVYEKVPVMPTVSKRATTQARSQGRQRRFGVTASWIAFAFFAFMGLGTPFPAALFFWFAALFVLPLRPIREILARLRFSRIAVWGIAVVLFFAGIALSPATESGETASGTAPARSFIAAAPEETETPAPTETPIPTNTPVPTDTPEPTAEPTPTPERIRGRSADTEVYVSNSNGIVHSRSNCSGMKYYWTTTIKAADEAGYAFCEKCW